MSTKQLRLDDLPVPITKNDLIGRVFPCPYHECGTLMDIGSGGVEHFGHRHMLRIDLDELFALATETYPKWREAQRKLLFGE